MRDKYVDHIITILVSLHWLWYNFLETILGDYYLLKNPPFICF